MGCEGAGVAPEGGTGDADSRPINVALSFVGSNLPADEVSALELPEHDFFDTAVTNERLTFDTDSGWLQVDSYERGFQPNGDTYRFHVVTTPSADVPEMGLMVVRRLELPPRITFQAVGSRPLIILAAEDVVIAGTLSASSFDPITVLTPNVRGSGSFSGGQADGEDGRGPGGGKGAVTNLDTPGGGGASYCTLGVQGESHTNAPGGMPGTTYGSVELIPLLGGSGGGAADWSAGIGGGAIQVTAGTSLTVTITGAVLALGMSGDGNEAYGSGSGGGSGGAILLESPSVTIAGTLGATGGAGGEQQGSTTFNRSGGAGGDGWIRINSGTGRDAFTSTALYLPDAASGCVSEGPLRSVATPGHEIVSPPVSCEGVVSVGPSCVVCLMERCCAEGAACLGEDRCRDTCLEGGCSAELGNGEPTLGLWTALRECGERECGPGCPTPPYPRPGYSQ